MIRLLRYLVISIFTLVLMVAGGLFILTTVVSPNQWKAPILAQIEQHTGQKLEIAGDLDWQFYPRIAIRVHEAQLPNPAGFSGPYLATIEKITLDAAWGPLLHGEFQINSIHIDGSVITLETNASGAQNWQTHTKHTSAATHDKISSSTTTPTDFSINDITLSNTKIHWLDKKTAQDITLTGLHTRFNLSRQQDKLSAQGTMSIAEVIANKIKSADISANWKLVNNQVTVNDLRAKLYEGHYTGNIFYDFGASPARWEKKGQLTDVAIQPFLTDLNGYHNLTGHLTMDANLSGSMQEKVIAHTTGQITVNLKNGQYQGINLNQWYERGEALLNKKTSVANILAEESKNNSNNATDITTMTATLALNKGIMTNNDLVIANALLHAAGNGMVNLLAETLDYTLNISKSTADLKATGKSFPLHLTGNLHSPKVSLPQDLLQQGIANTLKDKLPATINGKSTEPLNRALDLLMQKR